MLQAGITGTALVQVEENNTALSMKSGELEVFATPAMVALAEEAAGRSVAPHLEEGQTTVGTQIHLQHLSATPIGMTARAESRLTEVDGRRLTFEITVWDETGKIGQGTHERFIVDSGRFMQKALSKR